MNSSRFDTIVKNRANERVQNKVEAFKSQIRQAIRQLGIKTPGGFYEGWMPQDIKGDLRLVLDNVASGMYYKPGIPSRETPLQRCEWPAALWAAEEDAVQKELLATMDEMAKALCAPAPKDDDAKPQAEPAAS